MEISREGIEGISKDIAELEALLTHAEREHSLKLLKAEIASLKAKKELVLAQYF